MKLLMDRSDVINAMGFGDDVRGRSSGPDGCTVDGDQREGSSQCGM